MSQTIKIAFASGTEELNRLMLGRMRTIFPELPLYVVSDFPPEDKDLKWLPYYLDRTLGENLARCRAGLKGKSIRLAAVMLVPNVPFRRMRLLALLLSPAGFIAFNENLDNFMLRPGSLPAILKHMLWRTANAARSLRRSATATDWNRELWYGIAWLAGMLPPGPRRTPPRSAETPNLNTDRVLWPELAGAFDLIPDLFCAAAPARIPPPGRT